MTETQISDTSQATSDGPGNPMLALSNAMTRLYKELFGRGPTKVRAAYAGPDVVVVTLENTMTQAERNMARLGEHQRLRDVRLFFQHSSEPELRRPVEEILGRRVRAFTSGIDTQADVSVEVYILEPAQPAERPAAA
jgi:uncharacterized protein YbcI